MSAPATTPPPYLSTRPDGYVATKLWIDSVPEYSLLPNCAENRVSAIVRGMANGCGDGGKYTSFGCFCYSSSTHYNSLVGAQVATACNDQSAVTSAQNVFSKYCQQGQTPGVAPSCELAGWNSLCRAPISNDVISRACFDHIVCCTNHFSLPGYFDAV